MHNHDIVGDLSAVSRVVELADGDALVVEGDVADEVFFVRSGRLVATIATDQGASPLGTIEPGSLVGEVTVVAGGRRSATLRAAGPVEVIGLPRPDFERWLDAHPDAAEEVVRTARERVDRRQVAAMAVDHLGATDPDVIGSIVEGVGWRHLAPGEVLFEQGDRSDGAYFVISGRLLVIIADVDGIGQITGDELVREMGRGDVVGELGLIDQAPRSATVRAIRDTTLAWFSDELFADLAERFPGLMLHVARGLVKRMRGPQRRLADRAGVIAVVSIIAEPPPALVPVVVDELRRHATVTHLSSARVDDLLEREGIAQADDVQIPRLGEFLHETDLGNDHVVLEADRELTTWTRRVLLQADRVVLVMSPDPDVAELARLDAVRSVIEQLDHVVRLVAVVHPSGTERPVGTAGLIARAGASEVVHLRNGSEADLRRLARLVGGHGVGLVLSGGGARGFAHLGVYRALREAGVPIDSVGGCSIGAPIGGGIALDVPLDEIEDLVADQFHRLLDYTVPIVSLLKGRRITRNIERTFGDRDIEDLWVPYYCVSTNLTTSQVVVHRHGRVASFVRASVAIPGILSPVPHEGELLVDGGVLNNLPTTVMRRHGSIGTVIAVDVAPPRGPRAHADFGHSISGWRALATGRGKRSPYPTLSTVLLRSMLTGAVHNQREAMRADPVDLLLTMTLPGVGLLDFERSREVARIGYESAKPTVDDWVSKQTWMKVVP